MDTTTKIAFLGAIIYLVTAIDAVPDTIPVVGFLDDVTALNFVIRQHMHELQRFRSWKDENGRVIEEPAEQPICPCPCTIM